MMYARSRPIPGAPRRPRALSPPPSEFAIPLADGTAYNVPQEDIEVYRRL